MQALTDFGDLAVTLPVALCIGIWLVCHGWVKGARLWIVAFGTALLAMAVLKVSLLGCAPPGSSVTSPSGHTASSCFVYGGIVLLVLGRQWRSAVVIGLIVAVLMGLSRVVVHAHSPAEVVSGGIVGVAALAAFSRSAGHPPAGLQPWRLLLVCLALAMTLHGVRLNAEPRFRSAASWLSGHVCDVG